MDLGRSYKHISIVNYDSSIINKFEASLTGYARVVIYDHHMFIVQATGVDLIKLFWCNFTHYSLELYLFTIEKNNGYINTMV